MTRHYNAVFVFFIFILGFFVLPQSVSADCAGGIAEGWQTCNSQFPDRIYECQNGELVVATFCQSQRLCGSVNGVGSCNLPPGVTPLPTIGGQVEVITPTPIGAQVEILTPQPTRIDDPNISGRGEFGTDEEGQIVTSDFLKDINPLNLNQDNFWAQLFGLQGESRFATPAMLVNRLLRQFLFPLAGVILFVMILWGGFEMLYGANDTKSQEAGKQRITAALIGFLLLFVSYWIAQIVQVIFGVNVIGG